MTYFPDLTPYTYMGAPRSDMLCEFRGERHPPPPDLLNVGWLDISVPYHSGETSVTFQERLLEYCASEHLFQLTRGFHTCQFCENPPVGPLIVHQDGQEISLGNCEIRVVGRSAVYAAPTLIYHYVVAHAYRPPDEFIAAVLSGPRVGSPEYTALMEEYGMAE